jgi:molybdate transport system regulatory protein
MRAWLEWQGQSLMGQGRLDLLKLIQHHGSISAAARAMGVSYRAAWQWISDMNRVIGQPLVGTATGGRGGGGATLTPMGQAVIEAFGLLEVRLRDLENSLSEELGELF